MTLFQAVALAILVPIAIDQAKGQEIGLRCGPYHGWAECPPSELPECCSHYGFCSDFFTRADACAQEKKGIFYDGDNRTACIRDSDCQHPGQPGEYFCSQDPETMGYCGIRNVPVPFNGNNPLTFAPTTVVSTPAPTTAGVLNVEKASPASGSATDSGSQPATSSANYSAVTISLIGATLMIAFFL